MTDLEDVEKLRSESGLPAVRPLTFFPGLVVGLFGLPFLALGIVVALAWQFLRWGWAVGWWVHVRFEKRVDDDGEHGDVKATHTE